MVLLLGTTSCSAAQADSASYQLLNAGLAPGGYSISNSFQLNGAISQISIGPSLAADFKINAGLLYFPTITTPVVTAVAGDGQVSLSWTPAEGVWGWTADNYIVGQAAVTGGPYLDTSTGLATALIRSGLTNDLTYYFVVRVQDVFGNTIATSTEISAKPASSGGGGGGGGNTEARVTFLGRAYPLSDVVLLKDGTMAVSTKSGPDAKFEMNLSGLAAGNYNFSVYAIDDSGNQSLAQTFPISLTAGASALISGIFIAPSISVDKQEVKKGDNLAIFGQSAPTAEVVISINSAKEIFAKTPTDQAGAYLYNLDTVELELGNHTAKSKASKSGEISPFGSSIGFKVGTRNILALLAALRPKCPAKGDLNSDCKVNLVDFSIAAYWYKRPLAGAIIQTEKSKLNGDGRINLTDFSIIAYYWSG